MSATERFERARENHDLAATLELLRRRWPLLLGVIAASVAVAVARHERSAKTYTASSSVAFQSSTLSDAALQVSVSGSGEPVRDAATEVLIAHSAEVAQRVRQQLHLSTPLGELLEKVKVEAAANANILNILASTGSPGESATLANSFAEQYIAFKAQAQINSISSAQEQLTKQLEALPATSTERPALEQSIQRLSALRAVAGGSANIIGRATPPTSPSGTGLSTTVAIGVLVGMAIGLALIYLLESLDRRIKTVEEFEREYRLPALASIPETAFKTRLARERLELLEPYRILRSALDLSAAARPINTLLITSAVPGEGKTSVAVDLAHAVALTGRPVVLLELDLRRPSISAHFDLRPLAGLTTAITQPESLERLLIRPIPSLDQLRLLPAGVLPPNPAELLGSARVAEIITTLAESNTVIIDAPPLNPVADTHVLLNSPVVHSAVVVARVERTTRDEVRRARAILDRHTGSVTGLVVTGIRDPGLYGYEAHQPAEVRTAPLNAPEVRPAPQTLSRPSTGDVNLRLVS